MCQRSFFSFKWKGKALSKDRSFEAMLLRQIYSRSGPFVCCIFLGLSTLLGACFSRVNKATNSSLEPTVSFSSVIPSPATGNVSTVFSFNLSYEKVNSVNLQGSFLSLSYTGSASCDPPSISNASSLNPSVTVANCTGDGSLKVILSPGSSSSSDGTTDSGAMSLLVTVDNTSPTVSVGSPTPSSGNSSNTFSFPVSFSGADTVNLTGGDISVNATGVSCDLPATVTDGGSSNPTVSLTNCTGSGTVGITIDANVASDLAGNQSLASSASSLVSVSNGTCPTNYVLVPGNASYGTTDFCVMKYEARLLYDTDGDGDFSNASIIPDGNNSLTYNYDADYDTPSELAKYKAVSNASGRPWVGIKRGQNGAATGQGAIEACQRLNTQEAVTSKYDLITNDEWQTLARNIEAQTSGPTNNWGMDSFGDLVLNHGHSDDSPNQSCDSTNEYIDSDCANSGGESDYAEKRTHNLSNAEVIWDVAGNVYEWIKDNSISQYGSDTFFSQVTAATHPNTYSLSGGTTTTARNAKDQFGPLQDYTSSNSNNYGGIGYGFFNFYSGAIFRGGTWNDTDKSGVFYTFLYIAPTNTVSFTGFRCVYRP